MSGDEVQSPFLPGTDIQYAWDSTSLGYFKSCPRLYQYVMIDGWVSREESIHLRFGQEYHNALQYYEEMIAEGVKHNDAVHEVVKGILQWTHGWEPDPTTKAGKYKNRDSLIRTVVWYLDQYQDDAAKTYIMEDGSPAVELSFRFELEWGPTGPDVREINDPPRPTQPYLLCGHLDKVVEFSGALFDMDHKTTTTTPGSYYFDQYAPHNQMSLYSIAAQVVLDSPIKGVIINVAQLMVDTSRFVRGFTYRTQDQLDEWLADLRVILREAEAHATEGYWPMRDTSCSMFGGCRFRDVCSKSPQVREKFLRSDFIKQPEEEKWNPLRPR